MGNDSRSGVSTESLSLPLQLHWTHQPARAPQPAWSEPAAQDYFHKISNMQNVLAFDRVFDAVVAGDSVYFGSSSEDKVRCLDRVTGKVRWTVYVEGPVRCAPTVVDGRVYFGSDDGRVYCVSAETGKRIWSYRAGPEERWLPGNGRIISLWPVRSGLIVRNGVLYGAAGLFSTQGIFSFALDAVSGQVRWQGKPELPVQGYLMMSEERLFAPAGRMGPLVFDPATGKQLSAFAKSGGTQTLLTGQQVVYNTEVGSLMIRDSFRPEGRALNLQARQMVVNGPVAYALTESEIYALDWPKVLAELAKPDKVVVSAKTLRKTCELWSRPDSYRGGLIVAGDLIITGNAGQVVALDSRDGKPRWRAAVDGLPYGLAVAHGSLLVSTDSGAIHCFSAGTSPARPDSASRPSHVSKAGPVADPDLDMTVVPVPEKSPWPADLVTQSCAAAAELAVKQLGTKRGYCLVLGDDGRLAYEIATRTQMQVVILESDPARLTEARIQLGRMGLLGARISVIHGTLQSVRFSPYFANLIVSGQTVRGGAPPDSASGLYRVLRPEGGVAVIGRPAGQSGDWTEGSFRTWLKSAVPVSEAGVVTDGGLWGVIRRGPLPGAGEWTHCFGDAGNSACSGDKLAHGEMDVLWYGRPGPRHMLDRHHRNVPPLYKAGRLFVPGDGILFAMDAYNGNLLWHTDVPNARRLGVFLDCGNMAVDADRLHVARGENCLSLDVTTGQPGPTFRMPQLPDSVQHDWGYLALDGERIIGSGRRVGAGYTETSYKADIALWEDNMSVVTSDYLFGMDRQTGKTLWRYGAGQIINTTLAVKDGRLYFVESQGSTVAPKMNGRVQLSKLFADGQQFLVALETKSGRVIYRQPIDASNYAMLIYLNTASNVVLISGSKNVEKRVWYFFKALDAATGRELWSKSHDAGFKSGGEHGEQNHHPTIVGDIVYAWPLAYQLKTGEPVADWKFDRHGHGCGDVSAAAQALFWRGNYPWMRDLGASGLTAKLNSVVRPGCFINIIPAGGIVLIPEASSGCVCSLPLQMSVAHVPADKP